MKQVQRGQSLHMDVNLKGIGLSVMGGLQDELFNLTIERIKVAILPYLSIFACFSCTG